MKLSNQSLTQLNSNVETVAYDRSAVDIGVVHLGPGAFHRAHQAVYTDAVIAQGAKEWGICEVSINSAGVRDALAEQDNLYTLAILDQELSHRVVGAIKEVLVAPENPAKVVERLAQASVKVVTMTITEKGYCLTPEGGLDFNNDTIKHDLSNTTAPKSSIGFIVAGLAARKAQGVAPFTAISCDNLTDNGKRLKRAVIEFAASIDADLSAWIEAEVKFPCTMVDSITPATDDAVRASVAQATGLQDNWPIQRERFTQWVIEDVPGMTLPPWQDVGVTFSDDVQGYEATKLRILNGLHTSLAFIGLLTGLESVEEATKNPEIRAFLEAELAEEIIPTIPKVAGLDCAEYGEQILERFENPAIRHLLSQIAWDSSQKIPFRLLGTVTDNVVAGKSAARLSFAVAAWMKFICRKTAAESAITDPFADRLVAIAKQCSGAETDVALFLAIGEMFSDELKNNAQFVRDVSAAYVQIGDKTGSELTALLALVGSH